MDWMGYSQPIVEFAFEFSIGRWINLQDDQYIVVIDRNSIEEDRIFGYRDFHGVPGVDNNFLRFYIGFEFVIIDFKSLITKVNQSVLTDVFQGGVFDFDINVD